jgi:hypothetical protein
MVASQKQKDPEKKRMNVRWRKRFLNGPRNGMGESTGGRKMIKGASHGKRGERILVSETGGTSAEGGKEEDEKHKAEEKDVKMVREPEIRRYRVNPKRKTKRFHIECGR